MIFFRTSSMPRPAIQWVHKWRTSKVFWSKRLNVVYSWWEETRMRQKENHVQQSIDSTSNSSTKIHAKSVHIINLSIFMWLSNVKWQKRIDSGTMLIKCFRAGWAGCMNMVVVCAHFFFSRFIEFYVRKMLLANAVTRLHYIWFRFVSNKVLTAERIALYSPDFSHTNTCTTELIAMRRQYKRCVQVKYNK